MSTCNQYTLTFYGIHSSANFSFIYQNSTTSYINGLFQTAYPPDSTITYNWTEHLDDDLNRTIADTILTFNHSHAFHLEAQMYEDEEIELRVLDYGYKHALKLGRGSNVLHFPEPQIIYLCNSKHISNTTTLILNFAPQDSFHYEIPVYNLLEHTPEELSQHKMIILIPFIILKLKDNIRKKRTPENMEALRTLILDDIINLIQDKRDIGGAQC